jgi:hypothetical protein
MENLDYDKFVKNQEVREALFLLKNKVEKEKEQEKENKKEDNLLGGIEENEKLNLNLDEENENNFGEKIEETLVNLPPIMESKLGQLHDKDWDGKNLNEDHEILKKKMADKILKLDKVYLFNNILKFYFIFIS